MKVFVDVIKNNKRITIVDNYKTAPETRKLIESLDLTGNESADRLLIQKCIDDNKLKANILYEGNTIYSFNKIVKEYRKLQKNETLEQMSEIIYKFFMNVCGDIAHYNIDGYRYNYNNSFRCLENKLLSNEYLTSRFSDVDNIFRELKIGKYYKERKDIDFNKLSLNQLKTIIEKSDWKVIQNGKDWRLQLELNPKKRFEFDVDISSGNVFNIVGSLAKYSKNFNPDEYAKEIIVSNMSDPRLISAREIVCTSDKIAAKLNELVSNLIYRCRVAVETIKKDDLELEMER